MFPGLFLSLPFVLLFLIFQALGSGKSAKPKKSKSDGYQDGDIIIIRRAASKK
ncbi:MAG: hypothetical protein AAF579_03540 [Cyanobacteria bacterium P01_C01_bin.118]